MSKKSDEGRDVVAEIAARNMEDIMNAASPDTVEANKEAWQNLIDGYMAFTDKSLDDPEQIQEKVAAAIPRNDSDDSDDSDDESTNDDSE